MMTATEDVRPLLFGYLRVQLMGTRAELSLTRQQLAAFAEAEGYRLGKVYTDSAATAPSAFHTMVEAIRRRDVAAVVVPDLRHLTVLGSRPSLKGYLESCTDAQVLIAHPDPAIARSA
jgi:DNA invertase Pin-like site-specific DNA recombinase